MVCRKRRQSCRPPRRRACWLKACPQTPRKTSARGRQHSMADAPQPTRPAVTGGASRPASYPRGDQEVHILDRLAILYRYRRIASTVFVLTTTALMIQGYSNIRLFQAQARLLIEDERSA